MGFAENRAKKKHEKEISKLKKEYEAAYSNRKVDKALAALEKLFEMEDWQGTKLLLYAYINGNLKFEGSLYRSGNTVEKSQEKVRYYLKKMLDRYGEKVNLPKSQLSAEENLIIGGLKVRIAYTYYHYWLSATSLYEENCLSYALKPSSAKGNEYGKYLEWILDASKLNQCHDALIRLSLAYSSECELFGLERNIEKATTLAIAAQLNYDEGFRRLCPVEEFYPTILSFQLEGLLRELGKENVLAKVYQNKLRKIHQKIILQRQMHEMELEYARVTMKEELYNVEWYNATTGERIMNIDEELKKLEQSINNLEKYIASM